MLTIAIPTYNRNHLLQRALERLLPQLGAQHRVLIVDNGSDSAVQQTLAPWLASQPNANVRIVRNAVNIGGAANLLRCLELCETRWLYCLGDDDLVGPDCLATIDRTLAQQPEAVYVSFSRKDSRWPSAGCSYDLGGFIERMNDWSSFLFMSTAVVNADRLRTEVRWGHLYAYTWAPFQAILIKLLNHGGEVVFSDAVICSEESLAETTWVPFQVAACKMALPELVEDQVLRRSFAARLMAKPSALALVYWARALADDQASLGRNKFFLGLYLSRCAVYATGLNWVYMRLVQCIAFVVLRPVLLPTPVFRSVARLSFRLIGRSVPSVRPMTDSRL